LEIGLKLSAEVEFLMDSPQWLSTVIFLLYFGIFLLFLRYFWWGHLAQRDHWSKRPKLSTKKLRQEARARKTDVPFISILVPARNEAVVIANTIKHLCKLQYPSSRYEIVVITDQKETLQALNHPGSGPSTQEVVSALLESRASALPQIKQIDVPYDFDGLLGGRCVGTEIPSTKGRALNYGLGFLNPKSEICAFYDAESRPEKQILLYVAYRYLVSGAKEKIWCGPVFQVRNFYRLGLISRIGALYQCVSHEWYIPRLLKKLPLVGGTNFFVATELVERVKGFDCSTLTEDVEFGVRVYCETGEWPVYLPYGSTEQTPSSYQAFFRQRLRWGSGHLQVTKKYQNARGLFPEDRRQEMARVLWLKGEGEWLLFQGIFALTLGLLLAGVAGGFSITAFPLGELILFRLFALAYLGFTYYLYFRYSPLMDPPDGNQLLKKAEALAGILLLPFLSPFLLFPYTWALVLKFLGREPKAWVKTPRTSEAKKQAA